MRLLRFFPWLVGVGLLVGSILGANRLIHADTQTPLGGKPAPPPAAATDALITHGTVAAEQEVGQYTGSPLMAAGRVEKVFVKEGDEVKAGDKLYLFDNRAAKADVDRAEAQVQFAEKQKDQAIHKLQVEHPITIKRAELNVEANEQAKRNAQQAVNAASDALEKFLKITKNSDATPLNPADQAERRRNDLPLIQAQAQLDLADAAVRKAKYDREEAQKAPLAEAVATATAAVELAKADKSKAQLVQDECTIRAKVDGVVEQVLAVEGTMVGPSTRNPLLILVPKGSRIVRAEVQPDFAYKLKDRTGQKVEIQDEHNPAFKYEGIVRRVGSSFLPKRGGGADLLTGKPTLVLEVVIDVRDPAPPNQPPLRVGQPVRVSIQQ